MDDNTCLLYTSNAELQMYHLKVVHFFYTKMQDVINVFLMKLSVLQVGEITIKKSKVIYFVQLKFGIKKNNNG